jgi:hypothetical protein
MYKIICIYIYTYMYTYEILCYTPSDGISIVCPIRPPHPYRQIYLKENFKFSQKFDIFLTSIFYPELISEYAEGFID